MKVNKNFWIKGDYHYYRENICSLFPILPSSKVMLCRRGILNLEFSFSKTAFTGSPLPLQEKRILYVRVNKSFVM